ncbi:MAG TPA: radical SAM protein, partial [Polyangiaceae bacterium]
YYTLRVLSDATRRLIAQRLSAEVGRIDKDAPLRVALAYPSPYHVGMSSLGFQRVYRLIQESSGMGCERIFLPDGADQPGVPVRERPVSYEGLRTLGEFPIVAVSVAYELELAGLVKLLESSGIPPLAAERSPKHPFVLAGGPLTFGNPATLSPFADAVVLGEAEELLLPVLEVIAGSRSRSEALATLSRMPSVYVPSEHGDALPKPAICDDALLPAYSAIRTPHTELANMFLIEPERGCSRGCTYCVMRRSTNGGMRLVPQETVLERIPPDVRRVGLVGAAVSDHPRIADIVRKLAERGAEVGLSSLRPDRLKEDLISALRAGGYRTLTTALDGASERMRNLIERRGREPHYQTAAELARKYGMDRLKLYLMVGLPGESDEDIDECVRFVSDLSRVIPVALGVAPFCAKRNTPLDRMPFAGVTLVQERLARLRRGLAGRADVRATSAKWAWVEYVLSQGGRAEAEALLAAVRAGGRFGHYRKAFAELGHSPTGEGYEAAAPPPPSRPLRRSLSIV